MPRFFVTNASQQEVKKEVEEKVVETKLKKKVVKKTEEQTGDTWVEKQESSEN